MSLQVGKAVYNILSSDAQVKAEVGDRIYPLVAENTEFPFIVYRRTGTNKSTSKDKFVYDEESYVELNIASDKYEKSVNLAMLVEDALKHTKGIYSGINIESISIDNEDESFANDAFIQTITIKVRTIWQ